MESSENKKSTTISQSTSGDTESTNLKGDYKNVALLILLYILQGIPLGIAQAIPILLQNRGVSYSDQAKFSIALLPLGFKLLYAPIIDSVFIKSFGRRKTWVCSSQIILGAFMIYLSRSADDLIGDGDTKRPQVDILTIVFAILVLLSTIQDVAVDGWALTMLQRRNVGYASTTNNVGLSAGKVIGYIVLLVFESKDFGNKYIFSEPRDKGLFSLSEFIMFWACAYMIITSLVAIFKHENPENAEQLKEHSDYGVYKAFIMLVKIIRLKPVIEVCAMIFSVEACFAAFEALLSLKLIEYGAPKEKVALISLPAVPIQIFFPLLITKYTAGKKPLSFYYKAVIGRILNIVASTIFVFAAHMMLKDEKTVIYFYTGIVTLFMVDQAMHRCIYTAHGSFFAKVSDPLVGGTYITLLYTFGNLGNRFFNTISLWLVDKVTWKKCDFNESTDESFLSIFNHIGNNTCSNNVEKITCSEIGGTCNTIIDGFYVEIGISVIYGLIWLAIFKSVIHRLQRYPQDDWYVLTNRKSTKNV